MSMCRVIAAAVGAVSIALFGSAASADEVTVPMKLIPGVGPVNPIGTIRLRDSANGMLITFRLTSEVPPGLHGLHVHENPNCGAVEKDGVMVPGLAASGHYDPDKTGKHEGPSGRGHRGDLPLLYVDVDEEFGASRSRHTVVAPKLKVADVLGRSIIIHEAGDNYRDTPAPLGGGGKRIACGVIPGTAE